MENTIKGYDVYKNGEFIGFVTGQNAKIRKQTTSQLVTSTHMCSWSRVLVPRFNGSNKTWYKYYYHTTIGVNVEFHPCKRIAETISNYLLKF